MRVEPCALAHLRAIDLQPMQACWRDMVTDEECEALVRVGSWAGIDAAGRVLAIAGLIDRGGGRAEGWSLLSAAAGAALPAITRALRRGIAASAYRRVEIVTADSFPAAGRWAAIMGFRHEGRMRAWCEDGTDAHRWAITRSL